MADAFHPQPAPASIIPIPALRIVEGPSVALQSADVRGELLSVVSLRDRRGLRLDRWFGDRKTALAHAVELADNLGLLLFDLAEPEAQ